MTQKVRKGVSNGSKRQKLGKWWWIEQKIDMKTLSVELKPRLGTLNNNNDNDNNNNNNKQIMALNTEWRCGSERWNKWYVVALNVETENAMMALNADTDEWTTTLNAKWKTNNGSERQNWESMVAVNTERSETWLWTLKSGTQIGTSN